MNRDVLANVVTIIHLAYFVFVVGGFLGIVAGPGRRPGWAYNPWFRIVHLLSIFVVLTEYVTGWNCPLNVAESFLRSPGIENAEASSGFGYLLDQLLHHTISERVLEAMYWTLGLASLLLIVLVPPRWRKSSSGARLATDA
jgi:Protein of Unknown function (DUF2784)